MIKMAGIRAGAILVFLSVFPGSERVSGQRAPCYECEDYKENHPRTSPYQQIRTHCTYPCECEDKEPTCPPDVSIIRDGCGCCPICAGQLGQPCDGTSVCDDRKGLICRYPYLGAAVGICQVTAICPPVRYESKTGKSEQKLRHKLRHGNMDGGDVSMEDHGLGRNAHTRKNFQSTIPTPTKAEIRTKEYDRETATTGLPCMVFNKTYNHGETFQTDCRTQCSCQNGTYACSSLCPNENISPRGACTHPRLVEVPEQCCREWMCDSTEAEHPPVCKQEFTSWSTCSAECGLGISRRVSNLNQNCILRNETRICQLRPCEAGMLSLEQHARHRHIRKGHECKATQRVRGPVRLRFGPCRSKKRYRPKFCGSCDDKVGDGCCAPQLSTTIKVEFICSSVGSRQDPEDILLELIEPGRDLWWPDDLLAIGKQRTTQTPNIDGTPPQNSVNHIFSNDKIPYLDLKSRDKTQPILSAVSKEDMHLLQNKDKLDQPLLGGDVLVYEPGYDGKDHRESDGTLLRIITMSTPLTTTEGKQPLTSTTTTTTEQTTMHLASTDPTTPKPKKKRKKKPRKAFTSWLEFRDEEYQMDEYEDEDESNSARKKRNAEGIQLTKTDENQGKRYSGSFREGFLEELEDKDEEYDDDDEDDEDEDSDEEEEDDEEEDSEEEDDEEDEETTRRTRLQKKPIYYAFFRKKRETEVLQNRNGNYPKKWAVSKREEDKLNKDGSPVESGGEEKKDRMSRISERRRMMDRNVGGRKRKGKNKPRKKEMNEFPVFKPREVGGVASSKIGRVIAGRNAHKESRALFHVAGKVHKSRNRRHAPRPPWKDEEEEEEEEDLSWGDHTVSFSVQWIVKCRCDKDCGLGPTTVPSPINSIGEIILRRVHRTAPP